MEINGDFVLAEVNNAFHNETLHFEHSVNYKWLLFFALMELGGIRNIIANFVEVYSKSIKPISDRLL